MSRGKGRAQDAPANETPAETETTTATAAEAEERDDLVTQDPYDKLDGRKPNEAIRDALGAPNDYPYLDKTAPPLHERDMPVTTDAGGPSQAELNPAFYPKAEDGGPTVTNPETGEEEGIGTEPNVNEQMLAAAQTAEDNGMEGAVEQTEQQIADGEKQQMDAQAVTDAAPTPKDADGNEVTPAGAPSGMEPDSLTGQEDVPVAGADDGK